MVKHTQAIRRQQLTNCFSVFHHFLGLVLKLLSLLLFTIYLKTLERYLEKLVQDVQKNCFMLMTWVYGFMLLAWVNETLEGLKGTLEAWKEALESKGLRVYMLKRQK